MPHLKVSSITDLFAIAKYALSIFFHDFPLHCLNAQSFQHLEHCIHELCRWIADAIVFVVLSQFVERHEDDVVDARRTSGPFERRGRRSITLRLLGGHLIRLNLAHGRVPRNKRGRKRTRRSTGRGYQSVPVLGALGFINRTSPALVLMSCEHFAALPSFDQAIAMLKTRGVSYSKGFAHGLFKYASSLLMGTRDRWLAGELALDVDFDVTGKDVVIAFDGGRIRQRIDKQGRKKANGARNFDAPWVEPRQFVIYTLKEDGSGKIDKEIGKLADARIAKAPEMMKFLGAYLKAIEVGKANKVIVSADGQYWQWDRIRQMLSDVGVESSNIIEILDKAHALGHLHKISQVPKWNKAAKIRWYIKAKAHLLGGQLEQVEQMCKSLAVGRRGKKINSLTTYLSAHREKMRYKEFEKEGWPTGSGMVESMIRQVLNIRLKSCGKFWKKDNAQAMLMLRSWWVTSRFEPLFDATVAQMAPWWQPPSDRCLCLSGDPS